MKGNSIMMPQFDFQEKRRAGFKPVKAPKSGVVSSIFMFAPLLVWRN